MAKKRKAAVFLLGLVALLVLVALGLAGVVRLQRDRMASLEEAIASLQEETVPLRFMVTGRDGSSVSVRMRFYDLAGREFAMVERTVPGSQLYFDFLALPMYGTWLSFPWKLFSDEQAPADGFSLSLVTAPGGVPLTYGGGALDAAALRELGSLLAALEAGKPVEGSFGNAVHDVAELGSFETGIVYRVVLRKKGGIEIMEE